MKDLSHTISLKCSEQKYGLQSTSYTNTQHHTDTNTQQQQQKSSTFSNSESAHVHTWDWQIERNSRLYDRGSREKRVQLNEIALKIIQIYFTIHVIFIINTMNNILI